MWWYRSRASIVCTVDGRWQLANPPSIYSRRWRFRAQQAREVISLLLSDTISTTTIGFWRTSTPTCETGAAYGAGDAQVSSQLHLHLVLQLVAHHDGP